MNVALRIKMAEETTTPCGIGHNVAFNGIVHFTKKMSQLAMSDLPSISNGARYIGNALGFGLTTIGFGLSIIGIAQVICEVIKTYTSSKNNNETGQSTKKSNENEEKKEFLV